MKKQLQALVSTVRWALSLAGAVRSTPEVPDTQAALTAAIEALDAALIADGWWRNQAGTQYLSRNRRDEVKIEMGRITVLSEQQARIARSMAFDATERRNAR